MSQKSSALAIPEIINILLPSARESLAKHSQTRINSRSQFVERKSSFLSLIKFWPNIYSEVQHFLEIKYNITPSDIILDADSFVQCK